MNLRWAIISVEYPPQMGGVGDYTELLAGELAAAGDDVHVWAPSCEGELPQPHRVSIHRLPGRFNLRALFRLSSDIRSLQKPYRLLVQYVAQGFGFKAMNVAFCAWLWLRRAQKPWIMFHEVALPVRQTSSIQRRLQAHVTRQMARLLYLSAQHAFVSILGWRSQLDDIVGSSTRVEWLPVPSNMALRVHTDSIQEVRNRFVRDPDARLIGHFGVAVYDGVLNLQRALTLLLEADEKRCVLLVGRGSDELASSLRQAAPRIATRIHSAGVLSPTDVSAHLAACDLLIQPYPDGVSTRRGTIMAGLALGLPIVTNRGHLTEALWNDHGAVALCRSDEASDLVSCAESLIAQPNLRAELGTRATALYEERFAIRHTVRRLRSLYASAG